MNLFEILLLLALIVGLGGIILEINALCWRVDGIIKEMRLVTRDQRINSR